MPFGTIAVLPFRNPSRLSVLPRMVIRQGAKLNEKKKSIPGKIFRNFGCTSRGCPLFWTFWKMLLKGGKNFPR